MGISEGALKQWERYEKPPFVHLYPVIIRFLGYEPWPEPRRLSEALLAERRRRGQNIKTAAEAAGIDEGTWRRWERGEWRPMRASTAAVNNWLGYDAWDAFPGDVK